MTIVLNAIAVVWLLRFLGIRVPLVSLPGLGAALCAGLYLAYQVVPDAVMQLQGRALALGIVAVGFWVMFGRPRFAASKHSCCRRGWGAHCRCCDASTRRSWW